MSENRFEELVKPFGSAEEKPAMNTKRERVTTEHAETIDVYISCYEDATFSVGFCVMWKDGRTSSRKPSRENGWFFTYSDAMLYILGYFETYKNYFTEATNEAVKSKIKELCQQSLFDDDNKDV